MMGRAVIAGGGAPVEGPRRRTRKALSDRGEPGAQESSALSRAVERKRAPGSPGAPRDDQRPRTLRALVGLPTVRTTIADPRPLVVA